MIFLGADHRGFPLKEELIKRLAERGISHEDLGTFNEDPIDYPKVVHSVVSQILKTPESRGILVCGSGIGVSMAANRHKGIRAALCTSAKMAEMSRRHNNANILCMGTSFVDAKTALDMMDVFLGTAFEGGRHEKRVAMMDDSNFSCSV